MVPLGIGTDIIEIDRIQKAALRSPKFLTRIFKPDEIRFCQSRRNPWPSFAARFAAKEAVFKALGKVTSWQDIEIMGGGYHAVQVRLTGVAEKIAYSMRVDSILLSVSHDRERAVAFAAAILKSSIKE